MSALHGFWDWVLFTITVMLMFYAFLILINVLVLLFRGVGMSPGFLWSRILLIVLVGVGGFWMLTRGLGVL
jgi:hypothetical protein